MRILILVFLLLDMSFRVYALDYVQIVTEKNIEKLLDSIFENATNVTGVEATIYTAKSDEDALREFCSGYGDIVITNYYKDRTAKIDSNYFNICKENSIVLNANILGDYLNIYTKSNIRIKDIKSYFDYVYSEKDNINFLISGKKSNKEKYFADNKKNGNEELFSVSSGSGFIVSRDGFIITNNHVIDGCNEVKIIKETNYINSQVIQRDVINDLALLKINNDNNIFLPISISNPELMEDIFVAGFPFGSEISSTIKVTKGIVSSLSGYGNNFSNMQIDAAIQKGNSGGPIFDQRGNVLGVAVSKAPLKYILEKYDTIPENINFGIKSSVVRNFLESNGIKLVKPNNEKISRTELSKKIINSTVFLSCWMSEARYYKLKTEKVMFDNLNLD